MAVDPVLRGAIDDARAALWAQQMRLMETQNLGGPVPRVNEYQAPLTYLRGFLDHIDRWNRNRIPEHRMEITDLLRLLKENGA